MAGILAADITIESLSVTAGPTTGVTEVTVTGTEFLLGALCKFGPTASTANTVLSSSQLVCVAPALAAGECSLEVSNNDGADYTRVYDQFLYYGTTVGCQLLACVDDRLIVL